MDDARVAEIPPGKPADEGADDRQPDAPEKRQKPYRLGVLFVHGMGEQERGDTITQMGDVLTDWLRRRLANKEQLEQGTDFRIREATLRGSQTTTGTTSTSVSGLAHASVVLTGIDKGKPRSDEWLLAESWWADAFRPATFSELVAWAIASGPWLIASQEAGLHQRIRLAYADEPPPLWRRLVDRAVSAILVIAAALVAAIISPLAITLLVLSLIPVPVVSGAIRGLVQNLSGSFGDLLILVRSPVRFSAMAERVRSDIAWVDERADHVMVVAHSQGSAVSWHAIRRLAQEPPVGRPRVDLFLSFGQAFRKLKSLHRLHTAVTGFDQFRFVAFATLSTLLLIVAALQVITLLATLVDAQGSLGEMWRRSGPNVWIALTAFIGVGLIQRILRGQAERNDAGAEASILRDLDEVRREFPYFRWIDLWASADPAPNGPLFTKPVKGVRTIRIRNLASTALDHSVYWSNVTEFVSAVAHIASSLVEWSPLGREIIPKRLQDASDIRESRVSMLALGRVAVIAALIGALWVLRDSLPEIGNEVLSFVQSLPLLPDDWFTDWDSSWKGAVAALVVTLVAAASWWIMIGLWNAVIRTDEGAFFGTDKQPGWSAWAVGWAIAALLVPTAVMIGLAFVAGSVDGVVLYAVISLIGAMIVLVLLRGHESRLSDL